MFLRKHRAPIVATMLGVVGLLVIAAVRPSGHVSEAVAQPAGKVPAGDEQAIRQASTAYIAAMVAGDLDGVMAFWAPDADYIDESGKLTRGKDQIAALFKKTLPDLKGSKITGTQHSLKFLRPEVALQDGTIEVTTATGTKDSSRYAVVWNKVGDKWLIDSVRDLPSQVTDLPSIASAQLRDLEWLVGEWQDQDAKADVSLKVQWTANKAFLLMDYNVKREGMDPLEVTVRVGWDGASGRIRSWTFDSQGGFGEGFWEKDSKKWVVGTSGVLPDGGTGGATNIYEFVDANNFVWRSTDRDVDGQPLADAEVKFARKAAK
jgi:uncharacterized protein (TIGR02246 family)